MWNALENMALRESLPSPLQAGDSVHNILVAGQIPGGRFRIHHLGYRRSRPYFLKQHYSLDIDSFLRWQNESRFITLPETEGFAWPTEEWRGGLIIPHPGGITLSRWFGEGERSSHNRLAVTARIAERLSLLHASGIAHRRLHPSSIHVAEQEVTILDFGHAHHHAWDDLWRDSLRMPQDLTFTPPELLNGSESDFAEDIYAFGAMTFLLLASKPVFSPMKLRLREYLPSFIAPERFPRKADVPEQLVEAVEACLVPEPKDRPSATELLNIFGNYAEIPPPVLNRIGIHEEPASQKRRDRIMVFIKDDHRAVSLVDRVLERADAAPSLFLFVGMVPGNLPSGHLERFKGRLFQNLGHGLARCREAGVLWSLRVIENAVPATAARAIIEAYAPDLIMVGSGSSRRGLESRLRNLEIAIDSVG